MLFNWETKNARGIVIVQSWIFILILLAYWTVQYQNDNNYYIDRGENTNY